MRCFYVLKKWSSAKLSLNRDLSLNKVSLNRDCTVLYYKVGHYQNQTTGKKINFSAKEIFYLFYQIFHVRKFLYLTIHYRLWDVKGFQNNFHWFYTDKHKWRSIKNPDYNKIEFNFSWIEWKLFTYSEALIFQKSWYYSTTITHFTYYVFPII